MTGVFHRRRHHRSLIVTVLALVAIAVSALSPAGVAAAVGITLSPVVSGLDSPTQISNAHDGTNRLFVVEQRGTIRVIQNGVLQPGYFLDIRSKVEDGGERGLLGLAFHPQFASNHYLYVFYTRNGGDVVVSRFKTNAARTDAIESTAHPLLLIEHSAQSNHNGGALAFSPVDHYLYVGVGDGGGAGDPENDAQNKKSY